MFYHVFCINRKETTNTFLKKQSIVFFQSAFTLLISSLSFTLLIMLLNNLPISPDGPLNCICTHVSRKVETYYILLNPKLKIKFYTRWNPKWFVKNTPNCILSFFWMTQLLSISSKSELQLACFIHTLALNFKDWTFGVTVTRHFRPKSGRLNERVYCIPIERTLKMLLLRGRAAFYDQLFPSYWNYWLLDKKET